MAQVKLGITVKGGGINLTSVEMLFCINHRNIEPQVRILCGLL